MTKKWMGQVPTECQYCRKKIKNVFIDGKGQYGSWAIMCCSCHICYGVGFGTGKGQKYKINEFGVFIKTAG